MKTVRGSILLFVVFAGFAFSAERVTDIYESEESWTKALKNRNLLKNPAFKYVKTDPNLPRVLLYGDSISIGYTPYVRKKLAGSVTAQRIPCNGGDTASGFAKLKQAGMEKGKWDVIHFNWGLHDLKYVDEKGRKVSVAKGGQLRSVEEYKRNLVKLVALMKSSGAKLIFATTTPVGPNNAGRVEGDAKKYNEAAVSVMKQHNIVINDLYGLVYPKLKEYQRPNDVHYHPHGSAIMGMQVARSIYSVLYPEEAAKARRRVKRAQCVSGLRSLGMLALVYANDHKGWLPVAKGGNPRAHQSLQLLVEHFKEAGDPSLYICPGSKQVPAECDDTGEKHFVLTEENVSYAWRAKRLNTGASSARTLLACDKSLDNHNGDGVHVLYCDGSVRWMTKEELGEGGLEVFLKKHHLSR